jgi:hypothetical protein
VVAGCAEHGNPFRLTGLAPFWFVSELFIVEEKLLSGCEEEIRATVDAL